MKIMYRYQKKETSSQNLCMKAPFKKMMQLTIPQLINNKTFKSKEKYSISK